MEQKSPNETIKEYSKKTLDLLSEYKILPDPKSYEVWYEYVSDGNVEIKKAIDARLQKGELPDKEFTDRLHANILSYDAIARTVDSVTSMLMEQLSNISNSLSQTDSAFSSFSTILDKVVVAIEEKNFTQEMATDLKSATENLHERIETLENSLETSNSEIKKLENYLNTMRQEANIDPLTGLATRKKYDQMISQYIRGAIETDADMSVALFEVDHHDAFKLKWGQVTCEQILRFVAHSLKDNIKGRDFSARYSGSSFSLILPKTNIDGAKALAENIRNTIERKRIVKKSTGEFIGRVTLSIGIASYNSGESIGSLISRVDHALFAAKSKGNNCTVTDQEAQEIISSNNPSQQTGS